MFSSPFCSEHEGMFHHLATLAVVTDCHITYICGGLTCC